ncbi:biotin--[acetyl-CoA-carboxylase] ligase [Egibacter rhizosphaerae]|uniref:biotin--[biotin carboxyl-carrier protein] ligase n=1 Tax=Egibacter rhizosphaerae TaxID=1670831 RepID=A0A411YHB6_9ACTN|nr:biotin--[acetyl-CoA-carboxylase] ligase [Egibacter rhizosphaerae]QBI20658.1 biotin--[acetyl-CoA-carboxylase] ligase [Egibacter rhizosphaerae]
MPGPPDGLVRSLTTGSGGLAGFEWHEEVGSTNDLAAEAARRGASEIHLVLADHQVRGRGRRGREWRAPPGSSLTGTFLLRPGDAPVETLPLLAGVVLAEVVDAYLAPARALARERTATAPGANEGTGQERRGGPELGLKWPNDLLLRPGPNHSWTKAAGVLIEREGPAALLGIGCNVDWRGVPRPEGVVATSIAETIGEPVDRWRVLAGLVGVLARRYATWREDPRDTLAAYRDRCVTLGARVRVTGNASDLGDLEGEATGIGDDGRLLVATPRGERAVAAGDVIHLHEA